MRMRKKQKKWQGWQGWQGESETDFRGVEIREWGKGGSR